MAGATNEFIELYRKEKCIWDKKDPLYYNKTSRAAAIQRMSQGSRLSADEVLKRINNLRCQYKRHLHKVEESRRLGAGLADVYVPKWHYFARLDSFLSISHGSEASPQNYDSGYLDLWETCCDKVVKNEPPAISPSSPSQGSASTSEDTTEDLMDSTVSYPMALSACLTNPHHSSSKCDTCLLNRLRPMLDVDKSPANNTSSTPCKGVNTEATPGRVNYPSASQVAANHHVLDSCYTSAAIDTRPASVHFQKNVSINHKVPICINTLKKNGFVDQDLASNSKFSPAPVITERHCSDGCESLRNVQVTQTMSLASSERNLIGLEAPTVHAQADHDSFRPLSNASVPAPCSCTSTLDKVSMAVSCTAAVESPCSTAVADLASLAREPSQLSSLTSSRNKRKPDDSAIEPNLAMALRLIQESEAARANDDEDEHFARFIAKQLRMLRSHVTRLQLRMRIHQLLVRAHLQEASDLDATHAGHTSRHCNN